MPYSHWFASQASIRIAFVLLLLQCLCLFPVSARPLPGLAEPFLSRDLVTRDRAIIRNNTGTFQVFDNETKAVVPQGPATDGSGNGFDAPAIMWLAFSAVIGLPLAIAGIRGWRLTCGSGIGLAFSVCSYAAIINTVDEVGLSDLVLTCIVFVFFFIGFIMGFFEFARLGGIAFIGFTGGIAFGMRIVLGKDGLLIDSAYLANWAIVGVLGAAGGLIMIWKQRIGLTFGCASIGTFFIALLIDLIVSQQSGMSRGLRFLLDRNPSHLEDILVNGYSPSITTLVLLYSSLGLTPILAYLQHRIFKQPFSRLAQPDDSGLNVDYTVSEKAEAPRPSRVSTWSLAHMWEGIRLNNRSPNRFSLDSMRVGSRKLGRGLR